MHPRLGMWMVREALSGRGYGSSLLSARFYYEPETALKKIKRLFKEGTVFQCLGPEPMPTAITSLEQEPSCGGRMKMTHSQVQP